MQMNIQLWWLLGYNLPQFFTLLVISALTAQAFIQLAVQIRRTKSGSMTFWLGGGSLAIALGLSCTMLLAQSPGSVAPTVSPDLYQAVALLLACGLALWTAAQPHPTAAWMAGSSVALGVAFLTVGDLTTEASHWRDAFVDQAIVLRFLITVAGAYLFLKLGSFVADTRTAKACSRVAAAVGMGLLSTGCLVLSFHIAHTIRGSSATVSTPEGLPLLDFCFATVTVLVIALATTGISTQNQLRTDEARHSREQQRIQDAIADQRVTRLQNDALLQEIQERRRAEEQLRFAACHDAATGLENRIALTLQLTELLKDRQTRRPPAQGWVILINLDDLKTVNSLAGRAVTDQVLVEVATRLRTMMGRDDVLGRMSGDEFLVVLKQIPTSERAIRKAGLMLSRIEEPIALAGFVLNLSASLGLCEINASHDIAGDILRDADLAMQVAKRNGGKQCQLFSSTMRLDAMDLQRRKLELKTAVEREEFTLYYQPFVDMRDRSIYGMEALIRWNHPVEGLVAPGRFIQLAEETGQILPIGIWTLRTSCGQFAALQARSKTKLLLSVNVSPRQLFETPFLTILNDVLRETGMPPAQLQLEVTESIFIKDAPSIGALLRDVRALGVKIAFDDFGTGYSSLGYLTRYPIDTLKVDQSFVRGIRQNATGANLVLFMTRLASEFNMSVTAEGVEEVDQEAALLQHGCTHAQGYLYSRPVTLEAMGELLQHGLVQQQPEPKKRPHVSSVVGIVDTVFSSLNTH